MNRITSKLTEWYARHERPISSLSLVAGFVFDAVTLKRVDEFWENAWTIGHLLIVATCILLLHLEDSEKNLSENIEKKERRTFWLGIVMQFFFGGLLSTFLVFYFRSASLAVSWPFFLLLGAAFFANERLRKHSERLTFQIALFFLCLFSFAIFIVPVVVHHIGPWIFILAGVISLIVLWLFVLLIKRMSAHKFLRSQKGIYISVGAIFIGMNLFYFTNVIPPIPLSLADAGIYHSISSAAGGGYEVTKENLSWTHYLTFFDNFHTTEGSVVYAYSSVFSPASLDTTIVHVWERYDPTMNRWVEKGRVNLELYGGRADGYRTYSEQSGLEAGKWRVSVETPTGQVIGRVRFNLIYTAQVPVLVSETK